MSQLDLIEKAVEKARTIEEMKAELQSQYSKLCSNLEKKDDVDVDCDECSGSKLIELELKGDHALYFQYKSEV